MSVTHDAIVIGTGQAGPPLARRLAVGGMRVAIVERGHFGGTCVNTGCMPTKTLVASARVASVVRRSAEFGVMREGEAKIDMAIVKARYRAVTMQSRTGIESWLRGMANCTVYEGHARFTGPRSVRVNETELTAERIFINVGGRAVVPPLPGLDLVERLTNSSILELDTLPRHLIIVGGSYVGLEFAQIYRRLGSQVTVVEEGPRLVRREDEDVSLAVAEFLKREGVDVRLNARCIRVGLQGSDLAVGVEGGGASREAGPGAAQDAGSAPRRETGPGSRQEIPGSHLLLATGRRPNTDDLGLKTTGVAVDDRGYIKVDDFLQTSVSGIWALGDCNGRGAFTHTSYNDYEVVAANLLDGDSRKVTDRIPAYALYTDPPLGRAGLTEAEVRASGRAALVARRPMSKVSRAVEKGETEGFMKILVDAETRQILGAAILGTGGDEVIHTILDLMYAKAPCTVLQRAMHIHPTVSELLPTMMGELQPL